MPNEINDLILGCNQFHQKYFCDGDVVFRELIKNGQHPKTLVVSCSDSRVDPAILMNCKPGDLFVIRNVANLIPPFENDNTHHGTSAALEFGICSLGIRHVIVLGHSQCGGIQSLFADPKPNKENSFLSKWMELVHPIYDSVMHDYATDCIDIKTEACSHRALIHSLKNLETFPWIQERIATGRLFLHAWYFELSKGKFLAFNKDKHCFEELFPEKTKPFSVSYTQDE
ncbi:MAG: carbonic anhydrase [Alphaproteobacteria bacterium]|nr:carbonic anhydrase [Alphaproteobacteria bacterium]